MRSIKVQCLKSCTITCHNVTEISCLQNYTINGQFNTIKLHHYKTAPLTYNTECGSVNSLTTFGKLMRSVLESYNSA